MTTVEAFAPAKVNVTLHVTGQRPDGYHELDSLVMFADVGDHLALTQGPEIRLVVSGKFSDGVPNDRSNLVWRAAELAGWRGTIGLEKKLPHGGGIGGGSSDAAAVLAALGSADSGLSLGADVPVCRVRKAVRMRGIGEVLEPVTEWPDLPAVLVNPGTHVSTPAVFSAMENKQQPAMPAVPSTKSANIALEWLSAQRNHMQSAAIALAPEIEEVLEALSADQNARLVRMSGSGSTCFALFSTLAEAESAACGLCKIRPKWWVRACTLR